MPGPPSLAATTARDINGPQKIRGYGGGDFVTDTALLRPRFLIEAKRVRVRSNTNSPSSAACREKGSAARVHVLCILCITALYARRVCTVVVLWRAPPCTSHRPARLTAGGKDTGARPHVGSPQFHQSPHGEPGCASLSAPLSLSDGGNNMPLLPISTPHARFHGARL